MYWSRALATRRLFWTEGPVVLLTEIPSTWRLTASTHCDFVWADGREILLLLFDIQYLLFNWLLTDIIDDYWTIPSHLLILVFETQPWLLPILVTMTMTYCDIYCGWLMVIQYFNRSQYYSIGILAVEASSPLIQYCIQFIISRPNDPDVVILTSHCVYWQLLLCIVCGVVLLYYANCQ